MLWWNRPPYRINCGDRAKWERIALAEGTTGRTSFGDLTVEMESWQGHLAPAQTACVHSGGRLGHIERQFEGPATRSLNFLHHVSLGCLVVSDRGEHRTDDEVLQGVTMTQPDRQGHRFRAEFGLRFERRPS